MLNIDDNTKIPLNEIELSAVRSQGPGGQNVNKVSSAIHLRFDVRASSLSQEQKARILAIRDKRLTINGIIVIKAQNHRSRTRNESEALQRLAEMLAKALVVRKSRKPTKPSKGAIARRLKSKSERGTLKRLRRRPRDDQD